MLFNSYGFILGFLPVVLVGFFAIGRRRPQAAAGWLAGASLVFYAQWNWRLTGLLLASVAFNHAAGRLLAARVARGEASAARQWLPWFVAANLLLLGYCKYAGFFAAVTGAVLGQDLHLPPVILPLGISFFTFTQIAFLVDTVRGQAAKTGLLHYLLFVTYFPHLIAGPLLHHAEMLPQLRSPATYRPREQAIAVGLTVFLLGLFKKVVLADGVAAYANAGFAPGQAAGLDLAAAWAAALAYTLQIYLDFSAYCDMAIGLSRMFNIRLPTNFESPYKAGSIIAFWRSWHMTLSRFLRDYLYIPLGGNRLGAVRRQANLLATMLLGGLWHGAGWTFVIWGGLHGLYLVVNHAWRGLRRRGGAAGMAERLGGGVLTFLCVVVAWVVFRAPDLTIARGVLSGMAGLHGLAWPLTVDREEFFALAGLLALVLLAPNIRQIMAGEALVLPDGRAAPAGPAAWWHWQPTMAWAGACFTLVAVAMLEMTRVSQFLYFQF